MAAPTLQSYGPGNVDELLTTTLVNMIPGIKDNVFKSNPMFNWMYQGKGKKMTRGGAALSHGVLYETNSTAKSYQRFDILDITPQNGLTRDQWPWKQYSVAVSIDGFTERVNSGGQKIEDIMEEKKYQAEEAIALLLEQHAFAAAPGAMNIRSLPVVVLASGTEGEINGGTSTWWQSQVTASGSFAAQGRADLTNVWNTVSAQNPAGGPELIMSDQTAFEAYESSLVPQERFTDNRMVDIGIRNLKFKDTPWTWGLQATAGVIYLLHSSAIEFFVESATDFLVKPFVEPTNQDAKVSKILFMCALVTGNRRKLGKLTGVTA